MGQVGWIEWGRTGFQLESDHTGLISYWSIYTLTVVCMSICKMGAEDIHGRQDSPRDIWKGWRHGFGSVGSGFMGSGFMGSGSGSVCPSRSGGNRNPKELRSIQHKRPHIQERLKLKNKKPMKKIDKSHNLTDYIIKSSIIFYFLN